MDKAEFVEHAGRGTGCCVLLLHGTSAESIFVLVGVCGAQTICRLGEGTRLELPVPQSPVLGNRFDLGHQSLYPTSVAMS